MLVNVFVSDILLGAGAGVCVCVCGGGGGYLTMCMICFR